MSLNIANDTQWVALINRGISTLSQGNSVLAIELFQQAIQLNPNNPDSYGHLADAYRKSRQHEKALEYYDRVLELDPNRFEARINRGEVLRVRGRNTEAMNAWESVISEAAKLSGPPSPGTPADRFATVVSYAYNNLGVAYHDQGDIAQSLHLYRLAMEWDPGNSSARKNVLFTYAYSADADPQKALDLARQWWVHQTGHITPTTHPRPAKGFRPLRIGFVSADFRVHSVAYFLIGLFTKFDRSRHQLYCYSNVEMSDGFTSQFRKFATAWRSILGASDQAAAQMIAYDKIDILVDLGGFTDNSRLEVFAYRAAPIQVAYLGCPTSTGCPHIDWRITDAIADPPGMTETHFSERLWRLDRPAWCYHAISQIAAEETLPVFRQKTFTFASFNNIFKLTPAIIAMWADILCAVPDSRLVLKSTVLADAQFNDRLCKRFTDLGVQADRLSLLPRHMETDDHLGSYRDVDLALDTFPYNGTTTTCEALWMGVPVLTLSGQTHFSRVGNSLLSVVGIPELIASSPEEYKAIAVRLATDPASLATLRKGLRGRFEQSLLMNESQFTDAFCAALRGMWRQWADPKRSKEKS